MVFPVLEMPLELQEKIIYFFLNPHSVPLLAQASQDTPKPTSLNLLLTCRSMSTITTEVLKRYGCSYTAYIQVDGLASMQLHWTALPALPQYVRLLDITFRRGPAGDHYAHGWWGDGGPDLLTTSLLRTLAQFLMHGPQLVHHSNVSTVAIRLDRIRIEYETRDGDDGLFSESIKTRLTTQKTDMMMLFSGVFRVAHSGLLYGAVKVMEYHCNKWNVHKVHEIGGTSAVQQTALKWASYGWLPAQNECVCCEIYENCTYKKPVS